MPDYAPRRTSKISLQRNTEDPNDHIIAEWAAQYVDSDYLNNCISQLSQLLHATRTNYRKHLYNEVLLHQLYRELENKFWAHLDRDMTKIDKFYAQELEKVQIRLGEIRHFIKKGGFVKRPEYLVVAEENITELYRGLDLLNDYCVKNSEEIRRLAREWDSVNTEQKRGVTTVSNKLA